MVKSLPAKASGPVVKDAYAAIGLFAHACMLAVGFRLIGLGEDHKMGTCDALDYLYELTVFQMHLQIRKTIRRCPPIGMLLRHMHFDMHMHNRRWSI